MSRPIQRIQRPKKQRDKEPKEVDTNAPTVTQVPLTKYITHKDSPENQPKQTLKDSKKHKKNSGENPPDKRHHESEEKKEIMSINPQNNEMVNTQNTSLRDGDVLETPLNTENLEAQLNAMEQ